MTGTPTLIPVPALGKCITATLACKIGNNYGTSWAAQEYVDKILDSLTPDRWEYYLNQVFKVDETIILKLTNNNIIGEWNKTVEKYSLHEMNIKDHHVTRLLQASLNKQNNTVKDIAKNLYDGIR